MLKILKGRQTWRIIPLAQMLSHHSQLLAHSIQITPNFTRSGFYWDISLFTSPYALEILHSSYNVRVWYVLDIVLYTLFHV